MYIKRDAAKELKPVIKKILIDFSNNKFKSCLSVFGWNNIVENAVWHELKDQNYFSEFPQNLYKIVREVMDDDDVLTAWKL